MKKIFLICCSAGFISNGMAQSSVADVPENKIRPAYEMAPAIKSQKPSTVQKVVATQPVLNDAGLNAHTPPTLQPAPVITKPVVLPKSEPAVSSKPAGLQTVTATMQGPVEQKPVDKSSSVKEVPAVNRSN
jgi:hypothetical protein